MDCSQPDSTVHGILQARMPEWVAVSSSRASSQTRDWIWISCNSCIGRQILYHCATWEAHLICRLTVKVKVTQSCWALCDPTDYTVHGIIQAKILEWVAFPFSRGSSQPRSPTLQVDSLLRHKGSPTILEWVGYPFCSRSSQPSNWNRVSYIAGGFLNNWVIRGPIWSVG